LNKIFWRWAGKRG